MHVVFRYKPPVVKIFQAGLHRLKLPGDVVVPSPPMVEA